MLLKSFIGGEQCFFSLSQELECNLVVTTCSESIEKNVSLTSNINVLSGIFRFDFDEKLSNSILIIESDIYFILLD